MRPSAPPRSSAGNRERRRAEQLTRKQAIAQIADWSRETIDSAEQQRFIETVEAELVSLHEGNFARYQIRPSEFASWRKVWEAG